MILSCHHLTKAFGEQIIVQDGSFHMEERQKVALVGSNGAGKTTILRMIMKEVSPDSGNCTLAKGASISYLSQVREVDSDKTIYEELKMAKASVVELESRIQEVQKRIDSSTNSNMEQDLHLYHRLLSQFEQEDGYSYESEIMGVFKGLGFKEGELDKKVHTLSGGQKTRVALGKLLLLKADILLLDEPTNHLDLNAITWLETYIKNYSGAVLIVSHDRYFLNRIVTKIVEIEGHQLSSFEGNYSEYAKKKEDARATKIKAYLNYQREVKHQRAVIDKLRSFNREKSIKRAESREKMLAKVDAVEKPLDLNHEMKLSLKPNKLSGRDVLEVENLAKSFDHNFLFKDANLSIRRGEHIALIGDNGTGKTTLLRILSGFLEPDAGSFSLGSQVYVGYYDQEQEKLNPKNTIFEEIADAYPSLTHTKIRNVLAAFLFTGDEVYKLIDDLSGGEKGRLSLAKLMLSEANFLILDEPTNHLDILGKEILEQALKSYEGTVLYVSHDRYFINQTATRIIDLVNQTFVNYVGDYTYYLEKKEELTKIYATEATNSMDTTDGNTDISDNKLDYETQKEMQRMERKRKNDLAKVEAKLLDLEARDVEIDELMAREEIYTDPEQCAILSTEKAELHKEIDELYSTWANLAEDK